MINTSIFPLIKQSFGLIIRNARIDKGLSQRELAKLVYVEHSYLSKIENGKTPSPPSEEVIKSLAVHLNLDANELEKMIGRDNREIMQLLVCCGYYLGQITEGYAAQFLGVDRLEFRKIYDFYRETLENAQETSL